MVKNALEPEWEARFEGTSYGFRPGRGCHDAISKIYLLACPNRRKKWVVDADIQGAFDHINHQFLLEAIGEVPGRELIKQWLKAGYMENEVLHETPAGTPQGGIVTPPTMWQKMCWIGRLSFGCRGSISARRMGPGSEARR
jgi:RNA-directed DNA polymerase